jgi:hypothetical protein
MLHCINFRYPSIFLSIFADEGRHEWDLVELHTESNSKLHQLSHENEHSKSIDNAIHPLFADPYKALFQQTAHEEAIGDREIAASEFQQFFN